MQVTTFANVCGVVHVVGDDPADAILFGTFSEVDKWIRDEGLHFPHTVIFSDTVLHKGVPQMVPEFLVYRFLFDEANLNPVTGEVKRRIRFVGTPGQLARVRAMLDVSIFGATAEMLQEVLHASDEDVELLAKEGGWFALKKPDGTLFAQEELVECIPWEDEQIQTDDGWTIHKGPGGLFVVQNGTDSKTVKLTFDEPQDPPWTIEKSIVDVPQTFGLRVLGHEGGYGLSLPSFTHLLSINGQRCLVDCAPYTEKMLFHAGVTPQEIRTILVTHVHEDHIGGIAQFTQLARKVNIATTREIWEALLIKVGAVLDQPPHKVANYFGFDELIPGEPHEIYGAIVQPFRSVHSVSTLGFEISLGGKGVVVGADVPSRATLDTLIEENIITTDRRDQLLKYVEQQEFAFIADDGFILPYESEINEGRRASSFSITPLSHLSMTDSDDNLEDALSISETIRRLGADPEGADPEWSREWSRVFVHAHSIMAAEAGDYIVAQGDTAMDEFYIISHGILQVRVNDFPVARLTRGDFFGEKALLEEEKGVRNADVVAETPARLIVIPAGLFRSAFDARIGCGRNSSTV